MNLLGKITKTHLLLVFMTAAYLISLAILYTQASEVSAGTDYTITTAYRASEPVTPDAPQPPAPVNLNTATAEELQTLNGIGAVTAQRIIDYRTEHGPFQSIEDLLNVSGIGQATLEKFRDRVTVSLPSPPEETAQETPAPPEDTETSLPPETAEEPPAEPDFENTAPHEEPSGSESDASPAPQNEPEVPEDPETSEPSPEPDPSADDEPAKSALIDLNTATAEELQILNGIGPVLAQRIVDYRAEHGPFHNVDDLINVKGIGEATLSKFRDKVTVSGSENPIDHAVPNTDGQTESPALLNINTATYEELQTLNGIGPALAQRIVDYRAEHGPFQSIDELLNVKGIGEATLSKFRDQITVGESTESAPSDETTTPEENTNENTGR